MFNFNVLKFERKQLDGCSGGECESGRKRIKSSRILRTWWSLFAFRHFK